jgi:hypothetical protein
MRLSEIVALVSGSESITCARSFWCGKALLVIQNGRMQIRCRGESIFFNYSPSFGDVNADDWKIVKSLLAHSIDGSIEEVLIA